MELRVLGDSRGVRVNLLYLCATALRTSFLDYFVGGFGLAIAFVILIALVQMIPTPNPCDCPRERVEIRVGRNHVSSKTIVHHQPGCENYVGSGSCDLSK